MSGIDLPPTSDRVRSLHYAARTSPREHQCMDNALQVLASLLREGDRTARYVEGFACRPENPHPIHHAWAETSDGALLDTTPAYWEHAYHYFPGPSFTFEQVLGVLEDLRRRFDNIRVPMLLMLAEGEMLAAFRAAEDDAAAFCRRQGRPLSVPEHPTLVDALRARPMNMSVLAEPRSRRTGTVR